ncbi:MAG: hypothetical protein Kapaf2KO_15620 [Candidatus Kapaibacteriales bacterium]
MKYASIILITFSSLVISCGLFDTREPESPVNSGEGFVPQTSWQAVIENFESSFTNLATENYVLCFEPNKFSFQPSADAANTFTGIFADWEVLTSERRWLLNLSSNIDVGIRPRITLYPALPQSFADSVIYTAEYSLFVPHSQDNIANSFKGRLQFNIVRDANANWAVTNWIDQASDSTNLPEIPTFSHLKAAFFN